MRAKTKFTLKQDGNEQFYGKKYSKIEKTFEEKRKMEKKTNQKWFVIALTPFGNTTVFEEEIWKWR